MSDDEDYMSDKFLQTAEKRAPSLLYRAADKRQFDIMKKQIAMKEKNKPTKVIEQEKREEGLSSAIASDNKGFAMLMKMGYKPGQGIGKTETGITEPIPMEIKSDRHGLGKQQKQKSTKKQNVDTRLDSSHMNGFRERITQQKTEQLIKTDLYKSQKVCHQLDIEKNVQEPCESWFWPEVSLVKDDDESNDEDLEADESEESLTDTEKLEILTKYLRSRYFYCIWCGTIFDDEDDLRDNCPGSTRFDH